ncbi:MAG: hypothetical protein ACE5KJ_07470 [Candidatus Zixiibacteriota bacterium]
MIEFNYVKRYGVPDIPVLYVALKIGNKRIGGPALLDTGFDGGVYPNQILSEFLASTSPKKKEILEDTSGEVECDILELESEVFHPESDFRKSIGKVQIYLPTKDENLTEDVVVGREGRY